MLTDNFLQPLISFHFLNVLEVSPEQLPPTQFFADVYFKANKNTALLFWHCHMFAVQYRLMIDSQRYFAIKTDPTIKGPLNRNIMVFVLVVKYWDYHVPLNNMSPNTSIFPAAANNTIVKTVKLFRPVLISRSSQYISLCLIHLHHNPFVAVLMSLTRLIPVLWFLSNAPE